MANPVPNIGSVGASSLIPFAQGGVGGPAQTYLNLGQTSFTCNGVTPVTVAYAGLTANSVVIPSLKTVGGTVGALPVVQTVTPGTGFTIQGTASDTSVYSLLVVG